MKPKPVTRIPVLIAAGAIVLIGLVRCLHPDLVESLERMTFDMRARAALRFTPTVATNLGFVFIDDASIAFVLTNRTLGYRYRPYWPRSVYGRLVEELAAQGARAVALDIIFDELWPDQSEVRMADGSIMESDEFFALQMRRANNVILAVPPDLTPPSLFLTNA